MRPQLLALTLVVVSFAAGAEDQLPAELTPDQEKLAIDLAESAGMAIYRHDHAAAIATDSVRSLRAFRKDKRLRGWITEESGSAIVVTFVGAPAGQPVAALYRVVTSEYGQVVGDPVALDDPVPLTPFEASAAAARDTAVASGFEPCASKYNAVVLPSDSGSVRHWVVYLLPATTDQHVVPIGGTFRIELDSDGKTVISKRPFTRTCITLSRGGSTVALTVTHLLDSTPTEAHVFWSLWAGVPLYVMTPPNGTVWGIENGLIKLVERRAQ